MSAEFHEHVMKAIRDRIDTIPTDSMQSVYVWKFTADLMEMAIPAMIMFQLSGMSPDKLIEIFRAIADGLELAMQEAKKNAGK